MYHRLQPDHILWSYLTRGSHEGHQTGDWSFVTSSISAHQLQENMKLENKNNILIMLSNLISKYISQTFQVSIERTLITPSDPPKATRGPSPPEDLERNSMLQWWWQRFRKQKGKRKTNSLVIQNHKPQTKNSDSSLSNTIKYIFHVPVDRNWGSLLKISTLKDLHCKKKMEIFINFGNIWIAKRKKLRIGWSKLQST